MFVTKSKEENIIRATNLIKEAVNNGAKLVALPVS
jgi:predicted amidohydrolase